MQVLGKIEVFRNQRGYVTGILKSFENKELKGKVYIDVQGLDIKDDRTYTIEVTDGYLNVHHVESLTKDFDKLVISVKKHNLISVYPEKPTDKIKVDVSEKDDVLEGEDDGLPF